ncbi:PREDICTED: probable ATP-dependent RNA helicase kurz [Drosophila arizonae]|uniref:Probable ATP-dependent RNA helicase kurz n=1 Tax=Drosophila arizonae TaxID=7263 RepID=A0ABM1PUM2_DROAR|nr:PREDICTED: probable ATP-dependent RNA helicase kurz [Drosophila arizonae]
MGKTKFNKKARKNPHTIIDNSTAKSIQIEGEDVVQGNESIPTGYDEANALALPSKKRATKIIEKEHKVVKILTKKQRKNLQAIVDKKKKREGREQLLKDLGAVQIPETELNQYTSISQVQTVGLKRLHKIDEILDKKKERQTQQKMENKQSKGSGQRVNALKGGKRKLLVEEQEEIEAKRINPNIVNAEESEDSSEEEDSANDNDEVTEKMEENQPDEEKSVNAEESEDDNDKEGNGEEKEEMKENQADLPAKGEQQPPAANKQAALAMQLAKPSPMIIRKASAGTPKSVHKTVYVPVNRTAEVQAARLRLPILAEEQQVMELINENPIVVISGETGSGKTTQIPQFLYEAGYALNKMIGITEPRRVAAISMSNRVAHEMNLPSSEVSYLVRFEGNATPDTKIKFMTDGVLLKEIETDFLLSKYSVIVLDEAHERTINTDILIGLLSRIVPLRKKRSNELKLIIMSATLRVTDFTANAHLFKVPPPVIKVEARQYPVTIHFQKRCPSDYVEEAFKKTVKIHANLPEGGILIFVTGQREVMRLVYKLRQAFPYVGEEKKVETKQLSEAEQEEMRKLFKERRARRLLRRKGTVRPLPKVNLDDYKLPGEESETKMEKSLSNDILPKINRHDSKLPGDDTELDVYDSSFLPYPEKGAEDDDECEDEEEQQDSADLTNLQSTTTTQPLWVLPLYSMLPSEKQQRIFQPAPDGCRFCVVATNIAETSLTIPHIKYVVDCGRQKTRLYDKITGVSTFIVTYTSKASADQRAGRAGRISAGHCYRLYSSALYNDVFSDFSPPDILQKPVDDLMLQMRCMGIDRIMNFPFPSPPDQAQLKAAEQRLLVLGALEQSKTDGSEGTNPPRVTTLGETIACFPLAARFGKIIALSTQLDLMPYTVCMVAALSVPELFITPDGVKPEDERHMPTMMKWGHYKFRSGEFYKLGDPMMLLRTVCAYEYLGVYARVNKFCAVNGIRFNALDEIRKLRQQLTNDINLLIPGIKLCVNPKLRPPSDEQARALRQVLLAGMGDRVARKVPLDEISDKEERRRLKYAYNCADMEEPAFLHSSSVLQAATPDWIIYQEVYELKRDEGTKMFLRGITAIEPEWLLTYVPLLCNVHEVFEDPPPRYDQDNGRIFCFAKVTFSKAGWELPLCELRMPRSEKTCCYFGMYLLDGLVCPALDAFKPKLKSSPSSLIKKWSDLNDKVLRFKRALINKQIYSRESLFDQWKVQPDFLLDEYHQLLYDVSLSELTNIWPPMEKVEDST